ncbi:MAG: hypothetical protein A2007_03110 [Verrucomicrobia bacterium GWC2_42_7]|nr:MAG: hypothetical protein A2007_03110 [Verrucomicrobia bacterium GWC2_42_7]
MLFATATDNAGGPKYVTTTDLIGISGLIVMVFMEKVKGDVFSGKLLLVIQKQFSRTLSEKKVFAHN